MKINMKSISVYLLFMLMATAGIAQTTITLPSVIGDNMVIQQKTNAAIWGKAAPSKTISVATSWDEKKYSARTDQNGNWKVVVTTPAFGGPYQIDISDGDTISLKNVMVGEVWICSGQSNMEMPLAGWGLIKDYQQEINEAKYPDIRLLHLQQVTSNRPLENARLVNGGWQFCSPESVATFSSVAYFFARDVYKQTGVPIGVINTSWGGTIAEAWTSGTTLNTLPDFAAATKKIALTNQDKAMVKYRADLKLWTAQTFKKDAGYAGGKAGWAANNLNTTGWKTMALPGMWEEQGIPGLDGIVWFRKKITVPAAWAGKPLKVSLGTIDDNDITFFDGEKIGATNGFTTPRVYTIPAAKVKAGEHTLTVRVFDSGGGGGLYGGDKNTLSVSTEGAEPIALIGDWQYQVGLDFKTIAPVPAAGDGPNRPMVLYNAMINPLIRFAIRGAIWYQGESNADRAEQYRKLFPAMITDWRTKWKQGNFPFYYVQLANYMETATEPSPSAWAELRDAQLKTLTLPNTGMAVAIDIGETKDIHPKNKQEVGRRLALIALANTYAQKNPFSGPMLQSFQIDGTQVMLSFKFADGGLKVMGGGNQVKGFEIAGADQKFFWADAVIKDGKVVVSSARVPSPVAVRYGWANNPVCNLYNGADLPASPFRTDDWKGITYGKK